MRTAIALAVLGLLLAACGGGDAGAEVASLSDDPTDATDSATNAAADAVVDDEEEAVMAFAQCMRDNGIDMDDPTVDADGNVQLFGGGGGDPAATRAGGGDREELQQAFEACSEHMEGLSLGFGRGDQTEMEDTMLELAVCMRDNGIDMPDPDFSNFEPGGGGAEPGEGGGGPFGDVDIDDPAFQAALDACSDILSGFGPRGGDGGGAGGSNDG